MKGIKVKGIALSLVGLLLVAGIMGTVYARTERPSNPDHKVDLKLSDQDEPEWQDGVSATWTATNMAPGDEFAFDGSFVKLRGKFPKKVDVGKVNISCNYTVEEESPQTEADTDPDTNDHPDEMAKYMVITRCIYKFTYQEEVWEIDCLTGELATIPGEETPVEEGYDDRWQVQDVDGDGMQTFYDLKESPLINLPLLRKGGGKEACFEMSVRFHEDAGNEFQGDTFNLTMIYALEPR